MISLFIYIFLKYDLILHLQASVEAKNLRKSMEEGLLARTTINESKQKGEESPQENDSSSATLSVVLSTMVALCGSLCTGCAVSSFTFYIFLLLTCFWHYHNLYLAKNQNDPKD